MLERQAARVVPELPPKDGLGVDARLVDELVDDAVKVRALRGGGRGGMVGLGKLGGWGMWVGWWEGVCRGGRRWPSTNMVNSFSKRRLLRRAQRGRQGPGVAALIFFLARMFAMLHSAAQPSPGTGSQPM